MIRQRTTYWLYLSLYFPINFTQLIRAINVHSSGSTTKRKFSSILPTISDNYSSFSNPVVTGTVRWLSVSYI